MRPGFTLIESLIALVLFQIAMLALAATCAVAARDLGAANRHSRAQAVAEWRLASLRATACTSPAPGSRDLSGGLTEHWSVAAEGDVRVVTDSVVLIGRRGRETSVVARGWMLCEP